MTQSKDRGTRHAHAADRPSTFPRSPAPSDVDRLQYDLRESEERLRLAGAAGRFGYWSWNPADGVFTADARCAEMFDAAPSALSRLENLFAVTHPDDVARVRSAMESALRDL